MMDFIHNTLAPILALILIGALILSATRILGALVADFFRKPTQKELDKEAYLDGRFQDIKGVDHDYITWTRIKAPFGPYFMRDSLENLRMDITMHDYNNNLNKAEAAFMEQYAAKAQAGIKPSGESK